MEKVNFHIESSEGPYTSSLSVFKHSASGKCTFALVLLILASLKAIGLSVFASQSVGCSDPGFQRKCDSPINMSNTEPVFK